MNDIVQGMVMAAQLAVPLDGELVGITVRSLYVTLTATAIASVIGLPLAHGWRSRGFPGGAM